MKLPPNDQQIAQAAEAIRAQQRLQRHREWRAVAELAQTLAVRQGRNASGYAARWAAQNAVERNGNAQGARTA